MRIPSTRIVWSVVGLSFGCWLPSSVAQTAGHTPGTLITWGNKSLPYVAPGARYAAVAMGGFHSLALKSDGTVVAWGINGSGECTVPGGLSGVVAIAAGQYHSVALKSDGTVVAWGDNSYGQSTVPAGLGHVVAIAAADSHSLALKSDGTVVGWGDNYYGESTAPTGLGGAVAIAAGSYHSLALKSDGTVVAWGAGKTINLTDFPEYGQSIVPAGLSRNKGAPNALKKDLT